MRLESKYSLILISLSLSLSLYYKKISPLPSCQESRTRDQHYPGDDITPVCVTQVMLHCYPASYLQPSLPLTPTIPYQLSRPSLRPSISGPSSPSVAYPQRQLSDGLGPVAVPYCSFLLERYTNYLKLMLLCPNLIQPFSNFRPHFLHEVPLCPNLMPNYSLPITNTFITPPYLIWPIFPLRVVSPDTTFFPPLSDTTLS